MIIDGKLIKDDYGRSLLLRGVNLGGSSKVPVVPDGATHKSEGFYNHKQVSFIGRPFPLDEADEHFSRLKSWGFMFNRFLVTWEAIEHEGPGIYDLTYLEYIRSILEVAAAYDIKVFIDPHQDVWSRFTGGDGAPGWTLELVGLDIRKFQETGAAFTHQDHGDPLPQMIWSTNATKLAAATMFTLFFGGSDFAPATTIDGESCQDFFQRHYIDAMVELAKNIKDLPNVIGFDTMNEPVEGYIGISDLNKIYTTVEKGFIPTPIQSMQLGNGEAIVLDVWERGIWGARKIDRQLLNPKKERVWLDGYDPIWMKNGVWKPSVDGQAQILRPDHFYKVNGRSVDFNRDYYVPFNNLFSREIRKIKNDYFIFIEKGFRSGGPKWSDEDAQNVIYAPHWYDPVVLVMKKLNSWLNFDRGNNKMIIGRKRIADSFTEQLNRPIVHSRTQMGNVPTLIGEVGIAYDLNNKYAYQSGDFSEQIKAYDRTLIALESNLHHFTLWNYTADNTNERGDKWNDEDLSIFSRDQLEEPLDINSGGRGLKAILRPYPIATAGEPLKLGFDIRKRIFVYAFLNDPNIDEPTLIYVPKYQYLEGLMVQVKGGSTEIIAEEQMLVFQSQSNRIVCEIRIKPKIRENTHFLAKYIITNWFNTNFKQS